MLHQLNARMVEQDADGPYFLGKQLSLADIHLAPFLDRSEAKLAFYRNFDLLPEQDPNVSRLREFLSACRARPAYQQTNQTPEYYIWSERRTRWNANLVGPPWSETQPTARL